MRASPAFQLTIRHFGVWRCAVAALLICAIGALAAFALAEGESAPPMVRALAVAASILVVVSSASLLRCRPVSLRWDTQQWKLGPESSVGDEPWSGRVDVSLDLGAWMLLRFEHDAAMGRKRSMWVPVQRRGIEPAWHALRCAVYSARPAQGPDGGLRTSTTPESQE
jgi:hypothetical protein